MENIAKGYFFPLLVFNYIEKTGLVDVFLENFQTFFHPPLGEGMLRMPIVLKICFIVDFTLKIGKKTALL